MYGRDVVGYWQLRLTSRCRHPAPGQDLIPLQRLHVFAHSRDPHPAIKLWCQVPFTKSKTTSQIEMYCMQCFLKSNILKVELSMIKISELLRKLWSLRSCFNILPPGALTPSLTALIMACFLMVSILKLDLKGMLLKLQKHLLRGQWVQYDLMYLWIYILHIYIASLYQGCKTWKNIYISSLQCYKYIFIVPYSHLSCNYWKKYDSKPIYNHFPIEFLKPVLIVSLDTLINVLLTIKLQTV